MIISDANQIHPGDEIIDHKGNTEIVDGKYGSTIAIGRSCSVINKTLTITSSHALIGTDGMLYAVECPPFWRSTYQQYVTKDYFVEKRYDFSLADNLVKPLCIGQEVYGENGKTVIVESIESYPNQDPNLVGYDFSTSVTGTILCCGIVLNAKKNLFFDHNNWKPYPTDTKVDIIYNNDENKIIVLYNFDLSTLDYSYMIWDDSSKQFTPPFTLVSSEDYLQQHDNNYGGVTIVA